MTLSADEFRAGLAIRYGYELLNLPDKCDGCGAKFSVGHALPCKMGGLVIMRHNQVKDELGYLAGIATSSNAVRDEPLINQGHAEQQEEQQRMQMPTLNLTISKQLLKDFVETCWFEVSGPNRPVVLLMCASATQTVIQTSLQLQRKCCESKNWKRRRNTCSRARIVAGISLLMSCRYRWDVGN
eukprot:scaffold57788_cov61-Attheya_sp.AAC.4